MAGKHVAGKDVAGKRAVTEVGGEGNTDALTE
jgi:hypothetical protein